MARVAKKQDIDFKGFSKKTFAFFRGIDFYQSKDWYLQNKPVYEKEALQPMIGLVSELTREMKKLGLPLAGDPKTSLFRIHRDIRFSKDKTPYRTHIGATLSRDGRKLSPGMLYVHIAPDESFMAMGTYHPDRESLAALRQAIARNPKHWLNIIKKLEGEGLELSEREMLTRMPRGFESFAESPVADTLRQRSFIIRSPFPASSLGNRKLISEVVSFVKKGRKFLEFTWSAMDHARE